MNESDKMWDGERVWNKEEYINVIYPQYKQKSRESVNKLLNGLNGWEDKSIDTWEDKLLFGGDDDE